MDDFLKDLLNDFLVDSHEMIEEIENPLLELENGNDVSDNINIIFRAFHSVKGGAGMFKLDEITRLSHTLENRLDHYRKTQETITENDIAIFLTGSDLLKFMITAVQEDPPDSENILKKFSSDVDKVIQNVDGNSDNEAAGICSENLDSFKLEASENIVLIEESLIKLEENRKDNDLINTIFRCIHTIKGTSDYIGLKKIRNVTHEFESLLDVMRRNPEIEITDTQFDLFLETTDFVRDLIDNCPAENSSSEKGNELINKLKNESKNLLSPPPTANNEVQEIEDCPEIRIEEASGEEDNNQNNLEESVVKNVVLIQSLKQQTRNLNIQVAKCEKEGLEIGKNFHSIRRTINNIKRIANNNNCDSVVDACDEIQNVTSEIMLDALDDEQILIELQSFKGAISDFILGSNSNQNASINVKNDNTVDTKAPEPLLIKSSDVPTDKKKSSKTNAKTTKTTKSAQATFRIDQTVADDLTNLVGELTVAKNSLAHLHNGITSTDEALKKESIVLLQKLSNHINQLTNELNDNVMKMRMVPIKNVFQKFPRLVRDLSKKVDKKVKLIIEGEETEVDKTIVEGLADPLVHMVRNSLDHGIETSTERSQTDKDETATINLSAFHQGSKIVIELKDDGRGINTEKVLEKAINNKLLTKEQSENLSHDEIINYIMMPGFSTAEAVTDLSGRGVGMDVVKSNIEGLKGTIKIQSKYGVGTTFRLELPLTMSIVDALLVESHDKIYALSLDNIIETVKIKKRDFISVMNMKCISLRGNVIGVEYLSQLMQGKTKKIEINEMDSDELSTIVILKYDNKVVGVIVDRVLRNQEIVIKTLPSIYSEEKILSGASILGDGRAVLVLNTETIFSQITLAANKVG